MLRVLPIVVILVCLVYFAVQFTLSPAARVSTAIFSTDTLHTENVLNRISILYEKQAEIVASEMQGDGKRTEALLEEAMEELTSLVKEPGLMENPRVRELYRTIITEYEHFYGTSMDTLTLQQGEIFAFHAAAFEALNDTDEPLLEEIKASNLPYTSTTIPMTVNSLVKRSITFLLKEPDKHLNKWLSRGETYLPMIEQVLAEEKVPDELKYLAMIESGLNPRARSWVNASGMWQFMKATGHEYGLQVTPWVDERLDPEKATRAAARYLKSLHRQFGDWQLALAAYNCGPGNVRRAIKRSGTANPTFWNIYSHLPLETRNYVPMFIATSLVASSPHIFGATLPEAGPRYAYDHVPVLGSPSIKEIARLSGTDEQTVRALNPELLGSSLPPGSKPYMIRLPFGTYSEFVARYSELPEDAKQAAERHLVQRGETLSQIARKYGVSVAELKEANGMWLNVIRTGQHLMLPSPESSSSFTLAEADPLRVSYGIRSIRPLTVINPLEAPVLPSRPDPSELLASAEPIVVVPNRPAATETVSSKPKAAPASKAKTRKANSAKATQKKSGERVTHRVRSGETLSGIAQRYRVTTYSLQHWNNLKSSHIRSGQKLAVYPGKKVAKPRYTSYKVRPGDNLTVIARRHGVTVDRLKKWNSLRSSTIRPGQQLRIYS